MATAGFFDIRMRRDASHCSMETFLQSIERPAYRMALIASRNREDALDLVQEAMCKFVEKYASRPS